MKRVLSESSCARKFTERLFRFLLGRAKALRRAEKWHGPVSRASDRRISFFIFHRRRRRRTICFAAWRAPAKTGDCRSSWLTAARRKDDDGDDRIVTMPFCPCFIHAKTRLPRIQFFTGGIQDVARYDAVSDKSRRVEIPWNDKNYFHTILLNYGFCSE